MTLERLELFEGSDVEDSNTLISRSSRDEMTVRVPLASEDRVLVEVAAKESVDRGEGIVNFEILISFSKKRGRRTHDARA